MDKEIEKCKKAIEHLENAQTWVILHTPSKQLAIKLSEMYEEDILYLKNRIKELMKISNDPNVAFKHHKEA